MERVTSRGVSRRRVLQLALGAGIGGPLLAACGQDESEDPSNDPSTPASGDAGGQLSGEVSVALPMPTADSEDFYKEEFAKFEADTGVKVKFLPFPDAKFGEAIQGLFQSGDQPDVYRMIKAPAGPAASFEKGWNQPLDDYPAITDALQSNYGDSAFQPTTSGLHFDGKIYGAPGLGNLDVVQSFLFDQSVLDQYGVAVPETWSELREAAAKITTDSGGDVAGMAFVQDGNMLTNTMTQTLYVTAGPVRAAPGKTAVNLKTGKAGASHPSVVDAVALLRGMVEDGSVMAGWQNLKPPEFWQAWVARKAAMAPLAAWWASEILKIDPEAPMGITTWPVPDDGRKGYWPKNSDWRATWGISAEAQNTDAAAALIAFLTDVEHQRRYYEALQGTSPPLLSEFKDILTDEARQLLEVGEASTLRGPSANARNSEWRAVAAGIQAGMPKPTFNEIIFTAVNEGADYADLAGTYDEALQKVIDNEIDKAISEGSTISEDILAFPDWDPLEEYTTESQV